MVGCLLVLGLGAEFEVAGVVLPGAGVHYLATMRSLAIPQARLPALHSIYFQDPGAPAIGFGPLADLSFPPPD